MHESWQDKTIYWRIIQSETLGETLGEREKSRPESRQESRIGLYA